MSTSIKNQITSAIKRRKKKLPSVSYQLQKNNTEPLYQQVRSVITDHISEGRLNEGDRLPSLQQLSEEMGIAYATVARGVRTLVESGALEARIGSGTHVATPRRNETNSDAASGLIGYIGSSNDEGQQNFYYLSIVTGIESVTSQEDKRLILLNRHSKFGWDKVDGVLIQDGTPSRIVDELPSDLPCVCLLRAPEGVAGVVADEYNGARIGVRKLVGLGHQRIGYLVQNKAIEQVPSIRQRINGFRDALQEAGIKPEDNWLFGPQKILADDYVVWGHQSMSQWLASDFKSSGFTALFVQNDMVAIGAIKALQEAGLRVPQDVSVLSFDGTPVCQIFSPTIASVAVPLQRIGATAMELLARQISSGRASDETIVLPAEFQDGESVTACK